MAEAQDVRRQGRSHGDGFLEIVVQRTPAGVTLVVTGDLDLETAPRLQDVVAGLGADAGGQVDLDLSRLSFVDVAGARALAQAGETIRSTGGRPTARHLQARHREVADRLGLGRYLEIAPAEDVGR